MKSAQNSWADFVIQENVYDTAKCLSVFTVIYFPECQIYVVK